jgi:hypothetical protein
LWTNWLDGFDELDWLWLGGFAGWHDGLWRLLTLRSFECSFQRQYHVQYLAYVPDGIVVHARIYQAELDSISMATVLRHARKLQRNFLGQQGPFSG